MSRLHSTLAALANARASKFALAEELKSRRAAFDAEHAALIARLREETTDVEDLENTARTLALAAYSDTKDKAVAPGVEIKTGKEYLYAVGDALAWAKATKLCLVPESLDEKAFAKIAAATPLPFVTVKEVPKVYIATQLNAAVYAGLAPASVEAPV